MDKPVILIIYNDNDHRRELHNILSHFDFELIYADNGLQGVDALKYNPNLIITEVNLSFLNGISLGKVVREKESSKNIPIIFLHDELNLDHIKNARALDAKAFLIKPYLDNSIIYGVKRALGTKNLKTSTSNRPSVYEHCHLNSYDRQYA